MEKKTLNFRAFLCEDDDGDEPLFTDSITVSGETYDIAVDINSSKPIVFGTVKVGSLATTSLTLENRGHYDVNYTYVSPKSDVTCLNRVNIFMSLNLFFQGLNLTTCINYQLTTIKIYGSV